MPKQLIGTSAKTVQDPSDIFKDALPIFAINKPQFLLGSNIATANRLAPDQAQVASVNPIEAYIDLLLPEEEPVVLTITKDSQSLWSIMMLIDNREEIECITDSGSQIISMSLPLILGQMFPIDTSKEYTTPTYVNVPFPAQFVANKPAKRKGVQVKKKYKPVAMKTKPIAGHVSKDFRIE
ncbi:hypothetical protein C0989_001151 [Termitomyces sp. Mn162]|nr:hypothetical protein C0989_001151 [Termitomyces sp. Mn162]